MRGPVRVLQVPGDPEGKELGSDWLIASFGQADALDHGRRCMADFHLTTDHLHGTDVPEDLQFADTSAKLVADLVNLYYTDPVVRQALADYRSDP